jgi:fatty acid desaturase
MRLEMDRWLARYRVPLMVSAFDAVENVVRPNGKDNDAFLVGWHAPDTGEITSSWKLDELPPYLKQATSNPDWRSIYTDIPFRTQTQVTANAEKEARKSQKQNRILKAIFILWLAAIPAAWAIIQYVGPEWLALVVLLYSLWRAWLTWVKLLGHVKTFRSEEEKAEKQRKMDHYFYHCA